MSQSRRLSPSSAVRSIRGHIGRAKTLITSGAVADRAGQAAVLHHLRGVESGLAIVAPGEPSDEKEEDGPGGDPVRAGRDPTHFQPNGRFLSEAGQRFLFDLFDQGSSIRSAATVVGISPSSASDYHARWLAERPTLPIPL